MNNHCPIRVGIAGFGLSGKIFHAPFLSADSRYTLSRVYERTTERAREEYPDVEIVRSFSQLLDDGVDLVVITTPNQFHVPMAREALAAGKHVVVEKPAAASSEEVEELRRLAQERQVLFSVYQNRRLDGDFLTVKKLIHEGRLGDVVDYTCHFDRFIRGYRSKQWKREGGKGVDLLYDIGVHIIDQAVSLFGAPEEVYADLRRQRPESPGVDRFTVVLHYPDKRAVLSAGELVAQPGPHFMVNGRKATFLQYGLDVQEARLERGLRPAGDPAWGQADPASYGTLYTAAESGVLEERIPTETGNYGVYYDQLYRAIRQGEPLPVTPEEAALVLRILEAAQVSSQEKRRIALA